MNRRFVLGVLALLLTSQSHAAIVNAWIALRDDAQTAIKARMAADESGQTYAGPVTDRTARLFRLVHDRSTRERLFKTITVGARTYTVWDITFEGTGDELSRLSTEITALTTAYPSQVIVVGVWNFTTGDPIPGYTPHARILEFVPDGASLASAPKMMGQADRKLTP